jgi:hypothetical protein
MEAVAIVAGCGAQVVAWWVVASGGSIWAIVPPVLAACGLLGVATGEPALLGNRALGDGAATAAAAAAIGAVAGVALYLGTLAFTAVAARWERFRRHTEGSYARVRSMGVPAAATLTGVAVVGEELFWRALVQTQLAALVTPIAALALTAAAYAAVNAASRSLPIVAAAVVGGVLWAWLGLATGSILAPLLAHLAWTWLMLALPPAAGRAMMSP